MRTYEVTKPWITYEYLSTDLITRITGRSRIDAHCAVCGEVEHLSLKIPRFRKVIDKGPHPERLAFINAHLHPNVVHYPLLWSQPLRNIQR